MASTRIRLCTSRPLGLALLALAAFGCQSSGADAGEENDEGSDTSSESNPVVRVPERTEADRGSSESSQAPESEAPVESASGNPSAAEPAATETGSVAAPASTIAACVSGGGAYSDCETIFVTAVQAAPERCIQLTIDNCGTYGRQGLSGADTPTSWRLASGSVGSDATPCELGVFYSGSSSLANATGTITWDETAQSPTDITFDLTLELLTGDEPSIPLATSEPLRPAPCDE
jgi:hypothetical protein